MFTSFLSQNTLKKKMPPSNQIRIAALSNYKLSQLTFAPPDNCTLRKTALIKNIVEIIYQHTPNEYLTTQMKRWNYFTPESLEDMTQKDVEKIIYRYSQILYSTAISLGKNSIKKEQQFLYSDYPNITAETKEMNEFDSYYTSFFSSSIFAKDTFQDELASSSESDNDHQEDLFFLPEQLPQHQKNTKLEIAPNLSSMYQLRYPNNDNNNNEKGTSRFSWLSDTGVPTNSTLALNLANELMSLFDMEFNVDLSVPSLHDLKKLQSSNGSTTSLHKMFSANEYLSSDDEDDDNLQQELKVVQVNKVNINMTAERQLPIQQKQRNFVQKEFSLRQKQQQPKNKVFKLIPNLKQLGNKNSKSNSDDIISSDLFNIEPAAPTHSNFTTSHMLPHKPNYQYSHFSSSSGSDKSEQEQEEEEEEEEEGEEGDDDDEDSDDINNGTIAHEMRCSHLGSLQRVTPSSRTSSLSYRASLRDRFELSDENSSDTSSDYFNDSVDTFQVELNRSRDSAGIDSQTFKGFLNALSSIRKTKFRRSRANSIHQDIEQHHSSYTTIPSIDASFQTAVGEDPAFDTFSLNSTDKKHKNSMQKMVKCISGNGSSRHNSPDSRNLSSYHRNSSISNTSSVSAPSTAMSSSSLFSNDQTPNNKQYYRCNTKTPTSPTTFSPRVAKRDGVYTTSIISDTSSFNWVDETRQKEDFSSIRSEASSSKTMPTFFSNNNRQPQCLSRSSSTTSLGGFFKKLTTFNKKDKILQRA